MTIIIGILFFLVALQIIALIWSNWHYIGIIKLKRFADRNIEEFIINRDINSVIKALDYGIDINRQNESGMSILHIAIICGNKDITNLLLEKGADPNLGDKNLDTPLHWAIYTNNHKITNILLDNRANPFLENKQFITAYKTAMISNNPTLINLLRSYKNDHKFKRTN